MSIKEFIALKIDTTFSENEELPFPIVKRKIEKNTVLSPLHVVEQHAYFLQKGICKISIYAENGEERILEFFFPGSFFSSYTSFLTQSSSNVEVCALTDCEVEVISYVEIQKAYQHSLLANKLGRMVAEDYYIQKTNREKDFLSKSAKERYVEILQQRPELVKQIPIAMLAKYLGIQAESLSRIRKEIS